MALVGKNWGCVMSILMLCLVELFISLLEIFLWLIKVIGLVFLSIVCSCWIF